MKKFAFTTATALVAMAATPAMAQDAQPETFDGVYVGGFIGLDANAGSNADTLVFDTDQDGAFDNIVRTTTGSDAFSPGFCNGIANGARASSGCTSDDDDFVFGGRIGLDQRQGVLVTGIVLEGHTSNAADFTTGFSTTPASYTTIRELDYAISGRGRIGISPGDGRGLFYVTGGVSYAKIDYDFVTTNGANSFTLDDDSDWAFGAQLGGGAEVLVTPNIGFGVEYLYSQYNDDDLVVNVGPGTAGPTNPFLLVSGATDLRQRDTTLDTHSLRATLNFHF